MTPQRYQQLKAKIAEVCPDLGTYHDPHAGRFIEIGNSGVGFCEGADVLNPITIAHVLRTQYMYGDFDHPVAVDGNGTLSVMYGDDNEMVDVEWDMRKDLDGQSDEVKEWLCDVILKDE